jgi:putative ABC transport system permease protein
MNPLLVVRATIARHLGTYVLFILLVAVATAIGVAITAQETALRTGSARAADKFDLVIAAPGSQTDVVIRHLSSARHRSPARFSGGRKSAG